MATYLRVKLIDPILKLISSGITPENLSLSLVMGFTCGVFPVVGMTTVPCLLFIWILKCNPVATMTVNYLMTPINIATVVPFLWVSS